MSDSSGDMTMPSSNAAADAPHRVFPLAPPRGAGPLIGWARGSRPVGGSDDAQSAGSGYKLVPPGGGAFDGQDSGFQSAGSNRPIHLFSDGPLVVGREATGEHGERLDPNGAVAFVLGLDAESRLVVGYYHRLRHPEAADARDMSGRLLRLVAVAPLPEDVPVQHAAPAAATGGPDVAPAPVELAPLPAFDAVAAESPPGARPAQIDRIDVPVSMTGAMSPTPDQPDRRTLAEVEPPRGLGAMFGRRAPEGRGMLGSIRRHLVLAAAAMVLLVGGVGGWAATTELSGAVIAMGQLVVDSNVKQVQHPVGGVVAALNVRDGDHVEEGEVLIRLDGTQTRANLAIVVKALDELYARQARGIALRDGATALAFPPDIEARRSDPAVAGVLEGEERLFRTMLATNDGQKAQFREQVAQLEEQVRGMEQQLRAKEKEIEWNARELVGIRELWEKKLIDFARVTSAERDGARLEGEQGFLLSSIAEAKGKIAEIELRILQVDETLRTEMGKELADIRSRIAELVEKKVAAEDELQRLDIRSPQAGVVHELVLHTVGGVIRPGDTIMGIVPDSDTLTAEVKVPPQDIDQLHTGQAAILRFLTFNQQTTPALNARVDVVSPDVTTDQKTGATYYTVRVHVPEEEIARLEESKLMAGMPVEVFVQTNPRTVLSYLVKPLSDQVERAFRER